MQLNTTRTGALPVNSDTLRVTPKCRNVLVHPFESEDLVLEACVEVAEEWVRGEVWVGEESEGV